MEDASILANEPIAKRSLTVFIVADVSRSMRGNKIRTVNRVMREIVPQLRDIGGSDADVRIAVLSFSDGCEWMTPGPVPIEEFVWQDLSAGGWTCLGAACMELNRMMSREGFLGTPSVSYAPVVILLSDGGPTDRFEDAMYVLNGNRWFKHSLKVAVAIGRKARPEKLSMFTGDPDTVIPATNSRSLSDIIRLVVLRSSEIGSRSTSLVEPGLDPDAEKQREFREEVRRIAESEDFDYEEGW